GGVDAGREVVADGGGVDHGVEAAGPDVPFHELMEVVEGGIAVDLPAFRQPGSVGPEGGDRVRPGSEQDDAVAAGVGVEGDGGPGAAGEDVGQAAHAVDGGERVAGGDEEVHGMSSQVPGG